MTDRNHTTSTTEETKIKREILAALGKRTDLMIWSNPTGMAYTITGQPIRFGLKGSPDLIGVLNINGIGVFLGLEVKTPTGTQSKHQKLFQKAFQARGGLYFVCTSAAMAVQYVEAVKNLLNACIETGTDNIAELRN